MGIFNLKGNSIMKSYDTVFFDLDGTLSESGEGILYCIRKTVEDMNISVPENFVMGSVIGPPLSDSFYRMGLDDERVSLAVKTYKSYYNSKGKYMNRAYDGIKELLNELRDNGVKLGVATSKYERFAREIVEYIGLLPYFDFISGATADAQRQKKIDVLNHGIKNLEAVPERTALVGDTKFDAEGARLCGCGFIGVLYGYGTREEMQAEGAVDFAETAKNIKEFIL